MIRTLQIRGFRGFPGLQVDGLTRVNLFVGANNAGKTSILEAVELLAIGTPRGLWRSPMRRGEELFPSAEERSSEVDVSYLWFGHKLKPGSSFSISAEGDSRRFLECQIVEVRPEDEAEIAQPRLLPTEPEGPALGISLRSDMFPKSIMVRLSPYGGFPSEYRRRLFMSNVPESAEQVNFLGTEMTESIRFSQLWDSIVLTPEEASVIEALRIIEPKIERLAFVGESRRYPRTIFVKMSDSDERIPLGSVGDGLKRLLALSLNLIPAQRGVLLVDEIDTGLHFTVMENMWRLVIEIARRLNVQVFATTHSLDCVRALAWVKEKFAIASGDVALHRVEAGLDYTIAFSMDELMTAAKSHIEVR